MDSEKKNSKSAEMKISEFREELLKVKNEKRKLSENLKAVKGNSEVLEEELKVVKGLNKDIQKLVEEKAELIKDKNNEIMTIKTENESIKICIVEARAELNNLKLREQSEAKVEIKCSECGTVVQDYDKMKAHVRCFHSHSKSSQYEKLSKFEEYSCFYCGNNIHSEHDLKDHRAVCIQVLDISIVTELEDHPSQCEECLVKCKNKSELERHIIAYHELGTFYCDTWVTHAKPPGPKLHDGNNNG